MAKSRQARKLAVSAVTQLAPNMRRVTVQGEELAGFPEDAERAYFKLIFRQAAFQGATIEIHCCLF